MTAAGIDALSDGRFELGLGASGPQVIEGWHGVPYTAPSAAPARSSRSAARCGPARHRWSTTGATTRCPCPPDQGTGLGKPLKIIGRPVRSRIPIWVASLGERNVEMTAEVADGWLPILFIPEKAQDVWGKALDAGHASATPRWARCRSCAGGTVAIGEGEDVTGCRELARPMVALYVGGMGARGKNFYNELAHRYGYERKPPRSRTCTWPARKDEAAAKVPDELLELTSLCGPEGYVAERLAAFNEAGVTHLQVNADPHRRPDAGAAHREAPRPGRLI